MCGIFGVSGSTPAVPLIAAGLKKLEYRGYDSSRIKKTRIQRLRHQRDCRKRRKGNLALQVGGQSFPS